MSEVGGRRAWLRWLAMAGPIATGVLAALPAVAVWLDPVLRPRRRRGTRVVVGPASALRDEHPVPMTVVGERVDAWERAPRSTLGVVWLQRRPDGSILCHSAACPHLGCRVGYDERARQFVCPCHSSRFALDGRVLSGPSARPLDELPAERTADGMIAVRFARFRPRIATREEI
ncbi:MAG: Rieske (2Fe-2S) protein [Myxococcota bacterium]|nr:Rieske (2Fe-2S) protein [Myxococcota bacterium]